LGVTARRFSVAVGVDLVIGVLHDPLHRREAVDRSGHRLARHFTTEA